MRTGATHKLVQGALLATIQLLAPVAAADPAIQLVPHLPLQPVKYRQVDHRLEPIYDAHGQPVVEPLEMVALVDTPLPYGVRFTLQMPVSANTGFGSVVDASLEVWPYVLTHDCRVPPPPHAPHAQHYLLAMTMTSDGKAIAANVPALQLHQRFCFRVVANASLTDADQRSFTRVIENGVTNALLDPTVIRTVDQPGLTAAVAQAARAAGVPDDDARHYADTFHAAWLGQLANDAADQTYVAAYYGYQSAARNAVTVDANMKARAIGDVAATTFVAGMCQAWSWAAVELAVEDADAGEARKPYAQKLTDGTTALQTATTALRKKLHDALNDDLLRLIVRKIVFTSTAAMPGEGQPGAGTTTSHGNNFFSIDLGLTLAGPAAPSSYFGHVWIVPYIGVNLYATAVDRSIDFSQLVGTTRQRILQLVSLTLGLTLTSPSIPHYPLSGVVFDHFPLVAVGVRVSQYLRLTTGAIIYWFSDANPANGKLYIGGAPFVGAALDLDVIDAVSRLYTAYHH